MASTGKADGRGRMERRNQLFARAQGFLPAETGSSRSLAWVIAIMVFLVALALAASLALSGTALRWSSGLGQNLTVQVVDADPARRTADVAAALKLLETYPGVVQASAISDAQARELLRPWLGETADLDDLPVPALIDIRLNPAAAPDMELLRVRLGAVAPTAMIDDHGQWIGQLRALLRLLQVVGALVVVLIAAAMAAVVAFSTRASLASHRDAVEILHLIGAEDDIIGAEVQARYLRHGLKGGLIGALAAAIVLGLISWMVGRIENGLLADVQLGWASIAALVILPLAAAGLTTLVARLTVHRSLLDFS